MNSPFAWLAVQSVLQLIELQIKLSDEPKTCTVLRQVGREAVQNFVELHRPYEPPGVANWLEIFAKERSPS